MSNKSTSWSNVATWYNNLLEQDQDSYQEKVIKPNLLRMLNPQNGQTILDVGCGQGFFSRELAKFGVKVVGIDLAEDLLKIARAKSSKNETYLKLSAEKMSELKNESFNAAICVLALQNIKNISTAISEVARVLKKDGHLVLVLNHPVFRVPTASDWGFDSQKNIQYRKIDKYLSEITQKVDMTQGEKDIKKKKFTYTFHHPLQVYFKNFAKNGLFVIRLEEWISHKTSDKGTRKLAEDIARKEIPLFMALELKKF